MPDTVVAPQETVVAVQNTDVVVVAVGAQGPGGPPGPAGPAGSTSTIQLAAIPLGGLRVVAPNINGQLVYASSMDVTQAKSVVGITQSAVAAGAYATVVRVGEIVEPTWNWTVGSPVYLGTNGLLTQVPQVAPAAFSLVVGVPVTPTTLLVGIRDPIILI